jgi:hypothetical protein
MAPLHVCSKGFVQHQQTPWLCWLAVAAVLQFAFATVNGAAPENANPEPTPEVSP